MLYLATRTNRPGICHETLSLVPYVLVLLFLWWVTSSSLSLLDVLGALAMGLGPEWLSEGLFGFLG